MKLALGCSMLALTLLSATAAYADQCAYITKEQATIAFSHLKLGQTIYEFCERCGDKVPRAKVVRSLSVANAPSPGYWEVLVNSKGIDLAYTYIDYPNIDYPNKAQQRVNLALVATCPASGFTPLLSRPARNKR